MSQDRARELMAAALVELTPPPSLAPSPAPPPSIYTLVDAIRGELQRFRDEIVSKYCERESLYMIESDNRRKTAEARLNNYVARHTELVRGIKVIAGEHTRSHIATKLEKLLEDFT